MLKGSCAKHKSYAGECDIYSETNDKFQAIFKQLWESLKIGQSWIAYGKILSISSLDNPFMELYQIKSINISSCSDLKALVNYTEEHNVIQMGKVNSNARFFTR